MEASTVKPAAGPRATEAPLGRAGRFFEEAGEFVRFSALTFRALPGTFRYFSETMRQASLLVRGTSILLFAMNIFLAVSAVNFAFFLFRSIGAADYLGVFSGYINPRQLAPTMFGYVFAAKVCCGMAAETAAMNNQQEITALEATGVDPRQYVVGTRVLGVILFLPLAVAASLAGQLFGGWAQSVVILDGITSAQFLVGNWSAQTVANQVWAFVMIASVAIPCTLVACFYGLRAKGGPTGVGSAVAKSLVVNLVLVHTIAPLVAVLIYGTNLQLPFAN